MSSEKRSSRQEKKTNLPLDFNNLDPNGADLIQTTLAEEKNANDLENPVVPSDSLARYLAEVRKYPLLSREEEYKLAVQLWEDGDPKAAEKLVTSNLRFVIKVAAEYSRFGGRLIDLIQEGNVGLLHAVREFNPYKGTRLITYAVWWIRGYIQEYLMKQYSLVKIGTTQNQRKLFYRLQKEKNILDSLGQEPDVKLLSTRLGVRESDIQMMDQRLSGRDISLNLPVDHDGSTTLLDRETSDTPNIDDQLALRDDIESLTASLEALRPQLNEKEQILLEERMLSDTPITLQEIGDRFGITREAVRQIETRLMKKIREELKSD